MFTGIVEEVGTVRALDLESPQEGLCIDAAIVLEDAQLGDSIAVNGVCLTVTRLDTGHFTVGVMPETLRRTNLGDLQIGDAVNLERPLQPSTRLGGHFVQGHVDGTARVSRVEPDGTALMVTFDAGPELVRYVVEKGFVAVDGASLTVTHVNAAEFGIGLIAYSQEHLAPGMHSEGKRVNIEVDILAKYVEKLVVH